MPTIHATVDQLDHSASQGQARDHALIMDRPEAKGGQNKGPMGGEALLLGLGGCFMSNLLAAASWFSLWVRFRLSVSKSDSAS